ncbi:hypothetical protein B296_00023836, partial [Ensete ventricosum]
VSFFWPSSTGACREYERVWFEVTRKAGGTITSTVIPVMFGRYVGASDYIAVARHYHTVFLSDIPVMSMRIRDKFETETEGGKLRRDVLVAGSVGMGPAPSGITSLLSGQEEMFAFRRAVSRLIEMQTPSYRDGVQLFHPLFQQHNRQLTDDAPVSQHQPSL